MAHNHVGIPRFIERGFSQNDKAFVYDTIRKEVYSMAIDKLGTQNKYYEDDVEKEILAGGVEKEFGKFYNDFCGKTDFSKTDFSTTDFSTTDISRMIKLLRNNKKLVEQFFSFMFMRSKKILSDVNKESLSSKILGDLDHSELLRIQYAIKINPLKILGDEYVMLPVVNFSNILFINNSVGFGFISSKIKEYSFIMPLNTRVAILISGVSSGCDADFFYIERDKNNKADFINKSICKVEKECGNGFIFGTMRDEINKYGEYIEKQVADIG